MPFVPIVIALAFLVVLLVAAVGPALRIAQRRALEGEIGEIDFVPLEWQTPARVAAAQRFVPSPRGRSATEGFSAGRRLA